MNIQEIKKQAEKEIQEEEYRKAVDLYKSKIKTKKSFWNRFFPYRVIFIKKEN